MFRFIHRERISGSEGLDLVLDEIYPSDPAKGYVPSYTYFMILQETGEKVGSISLRVGDNENTYYGGHIGYGVDAPCQGHGYAAKACRALKSLAREHGLTEVFVTCNPENAASRRTCENIGAELVATLDIPDYNDMYRRGERQKLQFRWRL